MIKRKVRWTWIATALGAVIALSILVIWLMLQHKPAWYAPVEIAPQRIQSVRDDLLRTRSDLSEQMLLAKEPFEYRVSQDQLNDWLAAREDIWPLSREWLPPWMRDPMIVMDADGVRLAATLNDGSLRTVTSVKLAISADEEHIRLQLIEAKCGSFPVPRKFIQRQLEELERQGWNLEELGVTDQSRRQLPALLDGLRFPNVGMWTEPTVGGKSIRRRFRITEVWLEPGSLVAKIRPLEFRER